MLAVFKEQQQRPVCIGLVQKDQRRDEERCWQEPKPAGFVSGSKELGHLFVFVKRVLDGGITRSKLFFSHTKKFLFSHHAYGRQECHKSSSDRTKSVWEYLLRSRDVSYSDVNYNTTPGHSFIKTILEVILIKHGSNFCGKS